VSPGAGADRHLATAAACLAATVVPLIYLPGLAAPFIAPKTSALEVVAMLALLAFALRPAGAAPRWTRPLARAAGLVLVTTAASWVMATRTPEGAPYALSALARWVAFFGLACGAAVLADDRPARQTLLEAVAGAAAVVSVIGLWQHLELAPLAIPVISAPGSTFGNRNLAAEAVAMSLPFTAGAAMGGRARGTRLALVFALVLQLVYLAATRTRGAWIGGAAGLLAVLVLARPRWSRPVVAVALGAVALAAIAALIPGPRNPQYVGDTKRLASAVDVAQQSLDPRSVALRTRFGLWRRTLKMVRDQPVWGVGPGNWPVFFPRYAEPGAAQDGVSSAALQPRQAHDDLLERTAETGLVGLAALATLGWAVVSAARRRLRSADQETRASTAAASGALVALAGAGLTGFPLEMPATLALGGLALGLIAPGNPVASPPGDLAPRRRWLRAAAVGLSAGLLLWAGLRAERRLRGSAWLGRAEQTLRHDSSAETATQALSALDRARAASPDEFRVHLRAAQMLLQLRRHAEGALAARRALALEPFSPNAWATLAAAQLGTGDTAGALASAGRALDLLHDYPFALLVHAQAAQARGDQPGAAGDWDRLRALATGAADQSTTTAARAILRDHGPR
jgi:O-antigen ligase